MTDHRNRQPRGVPTGGQFAATENAESDVRLVEPVSADEARARGCRCDFNPGTTEGPEMDCPVHGMTGFRVMALGNGQTLTVSEDPEIVIAHVHHADSPEGEFHVEHGDMRVFFGYGDQGGDQRTFEDAAFAAADAAERLRDQTRQQDTEQDTEPTGTYGGKTAEQWREAATESRRRSAESFERSDTDGYLSQWASDTMARKYDACATLAEQGGKAEFPALRDADGHLVPAKIIDTPYGRAFALLDPVNPTGAFLGFVNFSSASTAEKRNAYYAKKGYRMGQVRVPATVKMSDGMMPTPYFDRADGGFDPAAEVVATEDRD